jgi:hypothetical protein
VLLAVVALLNAAVALLTLRGARQGVVGAEAMA